MKKYILIFLILSSVPFGKKASAALIDGGTMDSQHASSFAPEQVETTEDHVVPAFPGAEGYGRFTTGGRGGKVIAVTNLNDSGEGSLRAAIDEAGPRIVIFRVSGTIALKSPLRIREGDLTLAGQSAPGDGICIKDHPVILAADNIIMRYIRIRLGDETRVEADAIGGRGIRRVMIDHCTFSWSVDECVSFYTNEDFTMQWCIISESMDSSVHAKGRHGYGGIWGGTRATFHHNLIAHHSSRNPRFSGNNYSSDIPNRMLDFRNNVIYNWRINSAYGNEGGEVNMVNNYYKAGPATPERLAYRIVNPSKSYGKFYVEGNYVEGNKKISRDNWAGGVQCDDPEATRAAGPFPIAPVTTHSPKTAFARVMDYAGASLKRDEVDERVIQETRKGAARFNGSRTGVPGIIDSQQDVGGWPELKSEPAPVDSDGDGMPDAWEVANGLDPNKPNANGRDLHKDYDNIEVYLNSLVSRITQRQLK